MSQWKPRVLPIQSTSENIAEQTATTYERYKKIMEFKDTGFFLQNYVVEGGEATKNIENNTMIDVSAIVAALDQDLTYREGTTLAVSLPNVTYFLDYIDGDFHFDTNHPTGTAGTDYLTLATVSTNGSGLVDTITDTRSPLGGFRSNGDIHTASGTGIDELAGPGRTTETVKGNADDLAAHKADSVKHGPDFDPVSDLSINAPSGNIHYRLKRNGINVGLLYHGEGSDALFLRVYKSDDGLDYKALRMDYNDDEVSWEGNVLYHEGNLAYEEGEFTPAVAIGGSSANVTHASQNGRYTLIGNVLNFQLRIVLSSKGTDTGDVSITGFPFVSMGSNPFYATPLGNFANVTMPTNGLGLFGQIGTNSAEMFIRATRDNNTVVTLTDSEISDNTQFIIEGTYHIA